MSLIFIGCSKKEGLELEILNKSIVSLIPNEKNRFNTDSLQKSKTIITYKLTNNDNVPYYFNMKYFGRNEFFEKNEIQLHKANARFYDEEGKLVKVSFGISCFGDKEDCKFVYRDNLNNIAKKLNYDFDGFIKEVTDKINFIIYPKQSLYLEWYVNLPFAEMDSGQLYSLQFEENKKYNMEIVMSSDSTDYKKYISRTDLQTLKHNNIKVFHGIIKSKNKIPVKFID